MNILTASTIHSLETLKLIVKDLDNLFSSGWKFSPGGCGGQYTMDWLINMYGEAHAKETYENQEQGKLKLVQEYKNKDNKN